MTKLYNNRWHNESIKRLYIMWYIFRIVCFGQIAIVSRTKTYSL